MSRILTILSFFIFSLHLLAQDDGAQVGVTGNERGFFVRDFFSFGGVAHSQGGGIAYRRGYNNTAFSERSFQIEFVSQHHPKEIRISNNAYFSNARSFVYGKKNSVFTLRAGPTSAKILNDKPYWGGIELKHYYSFGFSLSMAKPVFLYIIGDNSSQYYYLKEEKYDPQKHDLSNIFGRAPFFKGFGQMKFYPGIYFQTGLGFEIGKDKSLIRQIDLYANIDFYFAKIPMMAYASNSNYFINFALAYHFGRRYEKK